MKRSFLIAVGMAVMLGMATAQPNQPAQDMPGMQMLGHEMSAHDSADSDASAGAMRSMEGHMDMGPHMKMTSLRKLQPRDEEKAERVVEAARKVAEKYQDYHVALNDGFRIFLPKIPQKQYHFTNYRYAFEARRHFNPDHPTSLLYEKQGEGYKLIGVMYTAPRSFSEDDLNDRIPLSIAEWHEHVNLCSPPRDRRGEAWGPNPKFGLRGSIVTEEECKANGGTFHPVVFGWMVHLYPFEKDGARIWSVERQAQGHTN